MLIVLITFTLTTALYACLLWYCARRVAKHLQGNPEAVKAVTDHVLVPLLGRATSEAEKKPEIKRTKGTLV